MEDSDKAEFRRALDEAFILAHKPKPERNLVAAYFTQLRMYDIAVIKAALIMHTRDTDQGSFAPKVADIIRQIEGGKQARAELAWTKVDQAVRTVGSLKSICFDDHIIHAVIHDMGGWVKLNRQGGDEYKFKQLEFVRRYQVYLGRPQFRYPNVLGNREYKLMLFGDPDQARTVYKNGFAESPKMIQSASALIGNIKIGDGEKNE